MDKLVVVRSLVGNQADHDAIQVFNGHHPRKPTPVGRLAAVRLRRGQGAGRRRPGDAAVPQPVLPHARTAPTTSPAPASSAPRSPPSARWGRRARTWCLRGVSVDRLADRKTLLRGFDGMRRDLDTTGTIEGDGPLHRAGVRPAHVVPAGRAPSTCRRKTRASSSATARATRRSSSTTTAARACRRAC